MSKYKIGDRVIDIKHRIMGEDTVISGVLPKKKWRRQQYLIPLGKTTHDFRYEGDLMLKEEPAGSARGATPAHTNEDELKGK